MQRAEGAFLPAGKKCLLPKNPKTVYNIIYNTLYTER